jgi:hypothetical protein
MSLNDIYIKKITQWVELDNAIEKRKSKLKVYADEKKKLEDDILDYIEDVDMKNLQINISDGFIKFIENKGFQGLSLKSLKDLLQNFFKTNPSNINADTIYDYIVQNREIKTKLMMKRHIT